MLGLIRMEKSEAMTDPFKERWFPAPTIMQWVQEYNQFHNTHFGYADVVCLVEDHILRQRVTRDHTQNAEYTFGSPLQIRRLMDMVPSMFVSFAWGGQSRHREDDAEQVPGSERSDCHFVYSARSSSAHQHTWNSCIRA